MDQGKLIFISGGVRSGKSSFAENIAKGISRSIGGHLHYIATGVGSDSEMKRRIEKHKQQRESGKEIWTTWEQPHRIGSLATKFSNKDILLLDCLTTLLNNELFTVQENSEKAYLFDSILNGIDELRSCCHTLVIVSNELLNEPLQDSKLVATYKLMLGTLHQEIVLKADEAYLVESRVPIKMKGV